MSRPGCSPSSVGFCLLVFFTALMAKPGGRARETFLAVYAWAFSLGSDLEKSGSSFVTGSLLSSDQNGAMNGPRWLRGHGASAVKHPCTPSGNSASPSRGRVGMQKTQG